MTAAIQKFKNVQTVFFVHLLPSDVVIICKNTKIAKRKVASTKDDKKYQVAEDLFDIIQLINTKTDACSEIIQNILDTSAFRGKKTRVSELNTNKSSLNRTSWRQHVRQFEQKLERNQELDIQKK